MKRDKTILKGRFDSMANIPAEMETKQDTFRITVKDDEGKIIYENGEEPFEFLVIPEGYGLQTALEHYGARLGEDQKQFLSEALKGDESIGKAVNEIRELVNSSLKASAKSSRYASIFNDKKPISEESIKSARARMVRDFVRTSGGNIAAETAIEVLNNSVWKDNPYTLVEFNADKGRI